MSKKDKTPTPTPRVGRLNTLDGVLKEMAAVYREARRGQMETPKASKLMYMLSQMRQTVEVQAIEVRLRALEGRT